MFNNNKNITGFPRQKLSDRKKTKGWGKDCIDKADELTVLNDEKIRTSFYNKRVNYNLYDDILDEADVHKICNPFGLPDFTSPAKMQNYPISISKLNRLIGEESKRKFEWRVVVGNEDAVTLKEMQKKQELVAYLQEQILQSGDEEAAKMVIENLQRMNTNYQDDREILSTKVLSYLYKEQDLKRKFNEGFKDALISSEEIYCADIVAGEPIARRVNPMQLYTLRSGDSPFIEDSDIILEETYLSPGQVIDTFYEFLTPEQIDRIEEGLFDAAEGSNDILNYTHDRTRLNASKLAAEDGRMVLDLDNKAWSGFGSTFDEYGNIRVVRVVWKSRRKMFERTYLDEFGDEQKDIVSEFYKANTIMGEKLKEMWINEYWEGTRIGKDIYVKIQPRPIQFRRMSNLSACAPGYVGTVYNTNDGKGKSLLDRMKPYQYLYNVFMYRLELAYSKYKGPIYELDMSKIPEEWSVDQWMYYAEVLGWAPIDPFNEGNKGAATGKLAGAFNTTGKVLDADIGNYIQHTVNMLDYLEGMLSKISGISPQREGSVAISEQVGNVERSIMQSSHITEPYFMVHDNTKIRFMKVLLETAKVAWKGKVKKVQHILDDQSIALLTIDGDLLNEAEYDVHVVNGGDTLAIEDMIKQLAHAGLQNDKLDFGQVIDIYTSESLSSMSRKIKSAEREKAEQMQKAQEQQSQIEQAKIEEMRRAAQEKTALEQEKLELERYKIDQDNATKLRIAEIQAYMRQEELDQNNNGIPDPTEIANLAIKERKLYQAQFDKEQDRYDGRMKDQRDREIKMKEIEAKKEIERLKIEQTKVQNENQEKMQEKQLAMKEKELALKKKQLSQKNKTK